MPIYKQNKKKDGKTQYKVVVCYTDNQGNNKQIARLVYGLDQAKETERALSLEIKNKTLSSNITLEELYNEYLAAKKHEVRKTSYVKSISVLKNHVLNTDLAKCHLNKLSMPQLQKWKNNVGKKDIKVSTKNNAIKEFKAMLNYAVKMEYIPKNPIIKLGRFNEPYFETKQDRLQYYTPEQFKAYINAAKETRSNLTDYGCYVFFNIAYYTGMRKGEINALKWSDLEGNVIHVRRSICQKVKSDDGNYEETPPKNKSSYRDLQIPDKLIKIINEYKDILKKNVGYNENMRLCGGISVITDTNLENHNIKYAELAGVPHIKIHDFRHSHASLLCNAGINIQEVARRLGHADVSMTWNTYAHLYPQEEEKALEILNNI